MIISKLQIEQCVLKLVTWLLVETFSDQECQLVSVLARGGHTNSSWPVVVEMSQLVGQLLDVFWLQSGLVLDNIVGGRVDSSLPHGLRHQEEVVSLGQGDHVINNSSTWRIAWLPVHLEEPGVDPLADHDVGKFQLVLRLVSLHKALLDGGNFVIHNVRDLTISNTIPT